MEAMDTASQPVRVLLVDDEEAFRQSTAKILRRRGFVVEEAASGSDALAMVRASSPDVLILDLRMPGMDGIATLQEIRAIDADLPAIILSGHGQYDDAVASIKLEVVDFLHKPVDVDLLAARIHHAHSHGRREVLREATIAELMVPPDGYRRLYVDQPVTEALDALRAALFPPAGVAETVQERLRSVLVFDRQERFVGILRFPDLLKLVLPSFFTSLPYTSYFTGMFLAQCKLVGKRRIADLLEDPVSVREDAPLIEAVHLMVIHHVVNLPVMRGNDLVGIIREKDIIVEIAGKIGV